MGELCYSNHASQLSAGPIAESLPTSLSAFSHRRARADSIASFTYYQDEDESTAGSDEYSIESPAVEEEFHFGEVEDEDDSADLEDQALNDDYVLHRRSSTQSRSSLRARLLRRDSATTGTSGRAYGRISQKVYMANEDLTVALAGFRTSATGMPVYIILCLCTCGIAYLLFRWLPRWYVALLGQPCRLSDCDWVVVEVDKTSQTSRDAAIADMLVESMGRDVCS